MPVCALCGVAAPSPFRAPPPEGAPVMDGRPGELTRSTLPRWILRCAGCGACAPDLSTLPVEVRDVPRSAEYLALRSPFLRWAALVAGTEAEPEALLQAAWEAEDKGADGTELRRRAAACWPPPADAEGIIRLADVQRRAGCLADAATTLDRLNAELDDATARLAAFERARVAAGDTARYQLSSALRPPARTPHVAHGKRPASSFWAKLIGARS